MFLALPYYSHSSAKSIHSFFLYTTQGDAEQAELQEHIYKWYSGVLYNWHESARKKNSFHDWNSTKFR